MLQQKILVPFFILLLGFISFSCKDSPVDSKPPCGGIDPGIVPEPPYDSPIWHPSGKFIGFNHTPLKSITYPYGENCWGEQHFDRDSTGFWLINVDGTNMRRIFPYKLQNPAWSPDGQWIAFVLNAQIYKMKFTGTAFDTTTLTQLTFEGRNFFPDWSPDGKWIAYNESICNNAIKCGIWLMKSDGTAHEFVANYGNYPNWNPTAAKIIYFTRAITSEGQVIGDSLWSFNTKTKVKKFFMQFSGRNYNNRYPKYSPDGTRIAFWSNSNVWLIDIAGSKLKQLTTLGVDVDFGIPFCWDPSGSNIVYTDYRHDDWGFDNGTLWIMNADGTNRKQITHGPKPNNL